MIQFAEITSADGAHAIPSRRLERMNDMLKMAIIGQEGHYFYALDGIAARTDIQLCAIAPGQAGGDIDALKQRTAAYSPRVYGDYAELLKAERPDIAVINPIYCYTAPITINCLRAGAHCFSEKPVATTLGDLEALRDCYAQSDRALCAMFGIKGEPWFQAIKAAVAAGEIGEVRLIHGQKSYRMGTRPEYYSKRALFGGLIPWVAIHAVDWAMDIGGRCASVAASHSTRANRGNGEMEATSALLMELENGVIATVTADFLRPDASARHDDDRLRVTGTRGMIEAVDGRVYLENDRPRRELALPARASYFSQFVDAILDGTARPLAQEAFDVTRVCLLARQSADEGTRINVGSI